VQFICYDQRKIINVFMPEEEQGKRPISFSNTSEPKRIRNAPKSQTQDQQPQPSHSTEELMPKYRIKVSEAFIQGNSKLIIKHLDQLLGPNSKTAGPLMYLTLASKCSDIEKLYIRRDFSNAKTCKWMECLKNDTTPEVKKLYKETQQRLSLFLIKELSEVINSDHNHNDKCNIIKKIVEEVKKFGIPEHIEKTHDALDGYIQSISETFQRESLSQKKEVDAIIETLKQDPGKEALSSKMSASSNSDVIDLESSDYSAVSALLNLGADSNVDASDSI